jgi:hypothetical protein
MILISCIIFEKKGVFLTIINLAFSGSSHDDDPILTILPLTDNFVVVLSFIFSYSFVHNGIKIPGLFTPNFGINLLLLFHISSPIKLPSF